MNKKLMAVAIAGALAAPAVSFAQASNVTLYGRLNLAFDNFSATGATAGSASDYKSRYRVNDNSSRFGVRGVEDLGGGLKAVFLIENGVVADTGTQTGQSGSANANTGLAARMAFVGLDGSWGRLTVGKQHVWWGNGQNEQWQTNYGSQGNGFFTGGFGRGMGTGISFNANTVQYTSPVWSGVNVVASYAPSAQERAAAGQNPNGKIVGLTVQGIHTNGIIWGVDWVSNQANDTLAGAAAVKATGAKVRGGWKYQPGAQVSVIWLSAKLDNPRTAAFSGTTFGQTPAGALGVPVDTTNSMTQAAWGVVWEHLFSNNVGFEVAWAKANNISGCNVAAACADTNATALFAGGRYLISKRTAFTLYYYKITNASNYNADMTAGGQSSIPTGTVPLGADPRVFGVSMIHNF